MRLAGELTWPSGTGPFPGLVFITGSGRQTRDEDVAGHKWFLVLSHFFTERGYAVWRADDRGVGKSTGDFSRATPLDFAADAAASMSWLKSLDFIDTNRVGFVGHSEGGVIAPLAAAQIDISFLVLFAGPALPMPDLLMRQYPDVLRAMGKSNEEAEAVLCRVERLTRILKESADPKIARAAFKVYLKGQKRSWLERHQTIQIWATPWGKFYADYDPASALKDCAVPVLGLFGGTDIQVAADVNEPAMKNMLVHPKSDTRTFVNRNHLFQNCDVGCILNYHKIEHAMDESVVDFACEWIASLA